MTKTAAHNMAVGISHYFETIQDSTEQINFLREFLNPIRFYSDSTGYFFVYNFDCINISHAILTHIQGTDLFDYQDPEGTYVIRRLSEIAKNGGGFLQYYWFDPKTQKQEKKIGYVEPIKGTNYFIGDGVYLNP
ncbi:MAG: cache domain-containing protein [Candidatus Cloacimonadota bacterium]|nr:cache domain-containing protein [Candidatus Cloacimonadota bacterium]